MILADWCILAAVIGYILWLLFRPKKDKCSGCCEHCSGCHK